MKINMINRIIVTALCIIFLTIINISVLSDKVALANSNTPPKIVSCQVFLPGENNNKPVPVSNLTVTLLIIGFDNNTNSNRVLGVANVPNNPLTSSNSISKINNEPDYEFYNLPALPDDEMYAMKNERNGRAWIEFGSSAWLSGNSGYDITTNSFDDKHTFPILSDISNGSLYGFVILNDPHNSPYDNRKSGVKVTLYSCLPYSESSGNVNTGIVNIPNNPQLTMSGDQVGMYRFEGLKPGFYNVTIEKDGMVGRKIINFTSDERNNNWIFNNLVLLQPSPAPQVDTPTPQSTSMPTATAVVTYTKSPTPVTTSQDTVAPTQSQVSSTPAPTPGFTFGNMIIIGCMLLVIGLLSCVRLQKK